MSQHIHEYADLHNNVAIWKHFPPFWSCVRGTTCHCYVDSHKGLLKRGFYIFFYLEPTVGVNMHICNFRRHDAQVTSLQRLTSAVINIMSTSVMLGIKQISPQALITPDSNLSRLSYVYFRMLFRCSAGYSASLCDDGCSGILKRVHAKRLHVLPSSLLRRLHNAGMTACWTASFSP